MEKKTTPEIPKRILPSFGEMLELIGKMEETGICKVEQIAANPYKLYRRRIRAELTLPLQVNCFRGFAELEYLDQLYGHELILDLEPNSYPKRDYPSPARYSVGARSFKTPPVPPENRKKFRGYIYTGALMLDSAAGGATITTLSGLDYYTEKPRNDQIIAQLIQVLQGAAKGQTPDEINSGLRPRAWAINRIRANTLRHLSNLIGL